MEGERGGWAEGAGGVAAVGFGRLSGLNLSQQGLLQYLEKLMPISMAAVLSHAGMVSVFFTDLSKCSFA